MDSSKPFYEVMGKSYLRPYEAGLRSLFAHVGNNVPRALRRVQQARKILARTGPVRPMEMGDIGAEYEFPA